MKNARIKRKRNTNVQRKNDKSPRKPKTKNALAEEKLYTPALSENEKRTCKAKMKMHVQSENKRTCKAKLENPRAMRKLKAHAQIENEKRTCKAKMKNARAKRKLKAHVQSEN